MVGTDPAGPLPRGAWSAGGMPWRVEGDAIVGGRANQEDTWLAAPIGGTSILMAVADGMGGHAGGEQASRLAVDAFAAAFANGIGSVPQRLEAALYEANRAIGQAADTPGLDGMGCTLVGACIEADRLSWVSVGDSPLWLWRRGRLRRLNEDHSMRAILAEDVAAGRISASQAAGDPHRNALFSVLMGGDITRIDLPVEGVAVQEGDAVLVASDGLLTLSEAGIAAWVSQATVDGSRSVAQTLLQAVEAEALPRQDNCSVVVAYWPRRSWMDRLFGIKQAYRQ